MDEMNLNDLINFYIYYHHLNMSVSLRIFVSLRFLASINFNDLFHCIWDTYLTVDHVERNELN